MSDHFDGRRFVNPTGIAGQPLSRVQRTLREPRTPWPKYVEVRPQVPPALEGAAAAVTFIGHATFLIQTAAGNILTDPVYSQRASPLSWVGPRRVRQELDWWQETTVGTVAISVTPAHHFSARTPFDRNLALWGGFALMAGQARVYVAGDTAYADFFRDIRRRLGPIDLALLPIGAYEPRWFMQAVHMNPAEAVQAHLDLDAAQSIAMHFGTFQLTTEGIDEPAQGLAAACRVRDVPPSRFRTLEVGESARVAARFG